MPANPANPTSPSRTTKPSKSAKRPALAPASRYEILAPSSLPGMEMQDTRLLPLDRIDHNPYQSRQAFDIESLQELADSVREHGVLEPILVRAADEAEGRYEIVAGERRYRAAVMAEQETIPARILEMDSKQAAIVTALENLQREDLDIEDEARQFAYLCEVLEMSQRELARMLGKNPVYISRRTRLLKRPDLMEEYRAGRLTLHQAAALAEPSPEEAAMSAESDSRGITAAADDEGDEGDSAGITAEDGGEAESGAQLELIEREDLSGFIVARGSGSEAGRSEQSDSAGITKSASRGTGRGAGGGGRRPMFRWRPLQQFSNWVGRTQVTDIPAEERATVRAQLTSIKEALEKQLAALEQLEKSS